MNGFVFEGLDELRAALQALPAELTDEASALVFDAGNAAADTVRAIYERHEVTGHLANAVSVAAQTTGEYGAGVVIRVNDPIAFLFDNGSQARHKVKGSSTGAMWGHTPPTHAFSGTMARGRRAMWGSLAAMLVSHGLVVSGDLA